MRRSNLLANQAIQNMKEIAHRTATNTTPHRAMRHGMVCGHGTVRSAVQVSSGGVYAEFVEAPSSQ